MITSMSVATRACSFQEDTGTTAIAFNLPQQSVAQLRIEWDT